MEAVDPVQVYLRLMVAAVYRDLVESVLPPDDSLEITYSNPKEVRKLTTAPIKIYRFLFLSNYGLV